MKKISTGQYTHIYIEREREREREKERDVYMYIYIYSRDIVTRTRSKVGSPLRDTSS